jgi:hypothetical protein
VDKTPDRIVRFVMNSVQLTKQAAKDNEVGRITFAKRIQNFLRVIRPPSENICQNLFGSVVKRSLWNPFQDFTEQLSETSGILFRKKVPKLSEIAFQKRLQNA